MRNRFFCFILIAIPFAVAGCEPLSSPVEPTPTVALAQDPPILTPAITFTPEQAAPSPTPEPPAATTPSPSAAPTAPGNQSTAGGEVGQIWSLADVRYSLEAGRLRVVWEMAEAGDDGPRYEVQQHTTDAGTRVEVVFTDVYAYEYPLADTFPIEPDDPTITRIDQMTIQDDAALGFAIDLAAPAEYEVTTLNDPVRVVVDVSY